MAESGLSSAKSSKDRQITATINSENLAIKIWNKEPKVFGN